MSRVRILKRADFRRHDDAVRARAWRRAGNRLGRRVDQLGLAVTALLVIDVGIHILGRGG